SKAYLRSSSASSAEPGVRPCEQTRPTAWPWPEDIVAASTNARFELEFHKANQIVTVPAPARPHYSGRHGETRKSVSRKHLALAILGVLLLALWGRWWWVSWQKNRLWTRPDVWIPAYHFLGPDFQHNYHAARHWLMGGDPYQGHFG